MQCCSKEFMLDLYQYFCYWSYYYCVYVFVCACMVGGDGSSSMQGNHCVATRLNWAFNRLWPKFIFRTVVFLLPLLPCPDVGCPVVGRTLKYARTLDGSLFRTYHRSGGHSVPLQPECYKRGGDQDNARNEHGREIKRTIPGEY